MRRILFKIFYTISLWELWSGLRVTGGYFFKRKDTVQFPDENAPTSPRFRGLHALRRYSKDGQERCIACKLCEAVCPALAINIESAVDQKGARYAKRYEIDLFKCIYCGLCEESCPVDAIVETDVTHYHFQKRGDEVMSKEALLAIGDHYETSIAQNKAKDVLYR